MRNIVRQFAELCAAVLPAQEPILEFGAYQVAGQESMIDLRPLFPGKKYIGADMRDGPGVDLVLNLHSIDLPDHSAGLVILMDTLEHVEYPRKAMEEVNRILQLDGIVILSSVMLFPIHDFPHDYWRYTPEAFRSLLKPFPASLVESAGDPNFPHTVVGIGFKNTPYVSLLDELHRRLQDWKTHWNQSVFVERKPSRCAVAGDIVKIHYTCRLRDGRLVESTADGPPRQIRIGGGQMNHALDHAILGMQAGEARTILLPFDKAYGPHDPGKVFRVDRRQFPQTTPLRLGQRLQIDPGSGQRTTVTVAAITDSTIQLDGNHPLAGQDLIYNIWLAEIFV